MCHAVTLSPTGNLDFQPSDIRLGIFGYVQSIFTSSIISHVCAGKSSRYGGNIALFVLLPTMLRDSQISIVEAPCVEVPVTATLAEASVAAFPPSRSSARVQIVRRRGRTSTTSVSAQTLPWIRTIAEKSLRSLLLMI
jgi:hypothetical protein